MKDILPHIITFVIGLVVLAVTAYIAWRLRHRIREKVAAWLRDHELEKSSLMNVWIECDKVGVAAKKIACKIFVVTEKTGEQQISEDILTPEALEKLYPDVYAQFQKQGHVRTSILQQVA